MIFRHGSGIFISLRTPGSSVLVPHKFNFELEVRADIPNGTLGMSITGGSDTHSKWNVENKSKIEPYSFRGGTSFSFVPTKETKTPVYEKRTSQLIASNNISVTTRQIRVICVPFLIVFSSFCGPKNHPIISS